MFNQDGLNTICLCINAGGKKRFAAIFWGIIGLVLLSTHAHSAIYSDPKWPCIQRKVDTLSLGVMWPDPVSDALELTEDQETLAGKLSQRRWSLNDIEMMVAAYADDNRGVPSASYGVLFQHVFNKLNQERLRLIKGIERYSLKQLALSKKIDEIRQEMASLGAKENPDFDRIDALEAKLDWDERIYRDRAQSLIFVCESPILIEKRVFAISRFLRKAAQQR